MPVQEIVIAMPGADGEKRNRLYNLYAQAGCKVKIYDFPLGNGDNSEINASFAHCPLKICCPVKA